MSDDATDRQLGISIRFIREWCEPTPANVCLDVEVFRQVWAAIMREAWLRALERELGEPLQ